MYVKPTHRELRRKIERKTLVCTLHFMRIFFLHQSVLQHHIQLILCLERPTCYFVLDITVSNPNYSTGLRFSSVLPDDKTVCYVDKLWIYPQITSKALFKPAITNSFDEVMIWRYVSLTVLTLIRPSWKQDPRRNIWYCTLMTVVRGAFKF